MQILGAQMFIMWYRGTSLLPTPLSPNDMSCLARCLHFMRKFNVFIAKWEARKLIMQRGGLIWARVYIYL